MPVNCHEQRIKGTIEESNLEIQRFKMEMTNNLKAFNRTLVDVLNLEQSDLPSNSKEYQVDRRLLLEFFEI